MSAIAYGSLCIKIGDDIVPVCPCQVHDRGEVLAATQTERESGKKMISHLRMGTIDIEVVERIKEEAD